MSIVNNDKQQALVNPLTRQNVHLFKFTKINSTLNENNIGQITVRCYIYL